MKNIAVLFLLILSTFGVNAETTLKYGISSMLSASSTFIHYEELNNYIAQKMDTESHIIHKENYSEMNQLIKNSQVDFASICTGAMLYLDESEYRLVAVPVINGVKTYNSVVIANSESGIDSLSDMQEKVFVMTDRLSNTGYLYPSYLFNRKFGDINSFFKKVYFTGTHDKSVYLVNKGVVDAGAVDELVFESIKANNPENVSNLEVIHRSPDFGMPPIVASNKMDNIKTEQLKAVLLNMHKDPEGSSILSELMIDRFVPAEESDYDIVHEIKKYVENHKK
ncbi:phosphate/phosphite/phosphonate ABC transporter substrate-binding protein [Limisalsivibrio acetivorans]|uniref:substrate-binding domain-containing protein n=1 Tax=Limisalsivibrio acetivorans TaxID=1304888 RepID=UPI0003B69F04|nr:phosphate/phosphite/phosphonate ABC transporter substrate-binding protein [Limisalsivibrio acetivorans]